MKHIKLFEAYSEELLKMQESMNPDDDYLSAGAAKILAKNFGTGFSPKEFGEYVEDYFNNPDDYDIDTDSDYYEALETAWDQIAEPHRMPVWQSTTVEASPIYKYYKEN